MTTTAEINQFTAARRNLSWGLAGLLAVDNWFLMPATVLIPRVRAHHRDGYAAPRPGERIPATGRASSVGYHQVLAGHGLQQGPLVASQLRGNRGRTWVPPSPPATFTQRGG
jgi:hypothetical protein